MDTPSVGNTEPSVQDQLLTYENNPHNTEEQQTCCGKVKAGLLSLWAGSTVQRDPYSPAESELFYKIDDGPPLLASIVLGFQQASLDISGSLSVAFSISVMLCAGDDPSAMSKIVSTSLVMCGAATIFQTAIGSRLPIAQGGSSTFLVPIVVLSSAPSWRCPGAAPASDACITSTNTTTVLDADFGWQERMQQLQGSLIAASFVEVFLGTFGLSGLLLRFIGPLTIAVVVSLIGLSLAPLVASFASLHWGVSIGTLSLVVLFSLYLGDITIPVPRCGKKKTKDPVRVPIFRLFSIFLAMVIMWFICYLLTITGYLDNAKDHGYSRDVNLIVDTNKTAEASYFYFPYPGQFGPPSFNLVAFLGFLVGTITSMIESIGDYHATAVVCGVPPPPQHAINRGLVLEGSAGVLSGLLGSGHATTSYSGNIGAISLTRVASRRVFYCAGLILVLCGISGKLTAALTTIPAPIIGGFLFIGLSLVIGVGLANVSKVNLDSTRNIAILGLSLMAGLVIPPWVQDQSKACAIKTGYSSLDQLLIAVFGTSMFVGGLVACVLDNTVTGSLEDRGITRKRVHDDLISSTQLPENSDGLEAYDLPFYSNWIKTSALRYFPVCPGFEGFSCSKKRKNGENVTDEVHRKGVITYNLEEEE